MSLRREGLKYLVGFSIVGATLTLAVVVDLVWQPRLDAVVPMALVGASIVLTLLLFVEILREEARRPRVVARRSGFTKKDARAEHIEALGDFMRLSNRDSQSAYRAQVFARVRAYMNDQSGRLHDHLDPNATTSATRESEPGMGHLFVVVPRADDPYWIRCNRAVEAMRYCRRVHPTGFDVAFWEKPLPARVKLVDLIG